MSTPFEADMARFDQAFRKADAIRTDADGFAWIDASRVPAAMLRSYRRLVEYGYVTGLLS
jgi:hypothetical protein